MTTPNQESLRDIMTHHAKRGKWLSAWERIYQHEMKKSPDKLYRAIEAVVHSADPLTLRPFHELILSTNILSCFIEREANTIVTEGYLNAMATGNYTVYGLGWLANPDNVLKQYPKSTCPDAASIIQEFYKSVRSRVDNCSVIVFPFVTNSIEIVCVPTLT